MEFSRVDRLQSQMIRDLAAILSEDLKDVPPHMITFTRTEISKDLKQAKVYFSVLGDEAAVERSFIFMKRHAGVIRRILGRRMRIKHSPELIFTFDKSSAHVLKVGELLNEIKKQDDSSTDK
ncbi:MAG: 30S ribosome-binding factor RbfA [candidate division Zixibacteria bacterium]